MEVGHLTVQLRTDKGKSAVRKLRNQGQIPGICYGPGNEPISIALEPKALQKALDPIKGMNTLLKMKIVGSSSAPKEIAVLLKETQQDAIRSELIHADFLRVDLGKAVRVVVPIIYTGKPAGVVAGGYLHLEHRTLPLLAVPDKIPANIEIDVSSLGMGQSIHISDLKLAEGLTPALSLDTTLCVITAPREEKAETAQAPVEGAAPADAKKAPEAKDAKAAAAKPAAAKPAAKGK